MKKLIFSAVIVALSLTSCSFIPDLQNNQDSIPSSAEMLAPADTISVLETVISDAEGCADGTSDTTTIKVKPDEVSTAVQSPDVSPAPPTVSVDEKKQYAGRIDTCLQTMQKTISSNLIVTNNASANNDPFWSAMVEKSSVIDVNPVEIASAVGMLPSETENSNACESEFIPFVYEPAFGDATSYSKLSPDQILAVIAEKTFGVSSRSVDIGYSETQNIYCTYIISNANPDYAVICALYAYVDNDKITQLGIETFTRAYSECYDENGCLSSIYNISNIPTETSFSGAYVVPEHRRMCDIAATVMSTGYYYQRSSAKFVSINDGSSYLDNCSHICSVHYVSWFYLT